MSDVETKRFEAIRWTGKETRRKLPYWLLGALEDGSARLIEDYDGIMLVINDPDGEIVAKSGDYVLLDGERIVLCRSVPTPQVEQTQEVKADVAVKKGMDHLKQRMKAAHKYGETANGKADEAVMSFMTWLADSIDEACLEGSDFERIRAVLDDIHAAMWGLPASDKAREQVIRLKGACLHPKENTEDVPGNSTA